MIYREEKKTYCDKIECLREGEPLIDRHVDMERIKGYMKDLFNSSGINMILFVSTALCTGSALWLIN